MLPIRTILHPTDFSKHSDYALGVAGSLARDYGSRLIVLHVLREAEPPEWLLDRMPGAFPWTNDSSRALERRLGQIRESAPALQVEVRVVDGIPAKEILRAAEADKVALIIMGTHGREGREDVLMGSVAEAVMREACCPVLTVRNPLPASPDSGPVIVDHVACPQCSVPTRRVHHRDFPEIRAECGTVAEAVGHLASKLSRARENVASERHREPIDGAIADVARFLDTLPAAGGGTAPSCRCKPEEGTTPKEGSRRSADPIPSPEESIP